MIKKLFAVIERIGEQEKKVFDDRLASFNDPMAKEIGWGLMRKCASGFRSYRRIHSVSGDIHFIPTIMALLFSLSFIAIGAYVMWDLLRFSNLISPNETWVYLFGLVFLIIGLISLISFARPIMFNRVNRIYSKGYLKKHEVPFHHIHAIQVVYDAGGPDSSCAYELNLVLKDKSRVHVYGHSKGDAVKEDAAEVAKLISVPIWDVTK